MIALIPFLAVAAVFVITPGPDVALVTKNALRLGQRAALLTTAGITTGVLVWTGVAAAGVAAILEGNSLAFMVVRLTGAAYLVCMGVRVWVRIRDGDRPTQRLADDSKQVMKAGSPFLQGIVNNLLNPKIAVLFTSLIPQFVTHGPSQPFEFVELATIFAGMGLCALTGYSILVNTTANFLARTNVRRAFDAITGTALVGLGVKAALDSG